VFLSHNIHSILFDRQNKMLGHDINQQLEYQAQQTFRADGPVSISSMEELRNLSEESRKGIRTVARRTLASKNTSKTSFITKTGCVDQRKI
jgi:hypothetical protein